MDLLKAAKQYASFFLPKPGFGYGIGEPGRGRTIKGRCTLEKGYLDRDGWCVVLGELVRRV